jgi:pimeloyl-ACP methyl ester carboxylesterase
VSDVLALADHAGLARYAFIGYSFGGFVGLEVAMRDPRLVALVTLGTVFEPADAVPDASRYDDPVKTAGMEGLLQAIAHDEGIELPAWLARDFLATDPVQFALTMDANADHPDPWHELGRIGAQTVLIAGGLEDPDGMQDRMAAAMPEASSVHIDGVGHVGGFLRPDDVVAAALPLLRAGQSGTVG